MTDQYICNQNYTKHQEENTKKKMIEVDVKVASSTKDHNYISRGVMHIASNTTHCTA